jgi:hypothetical protein
MLQNQAKAHAQAKKQHAIEIFFNKIKTGFSEFFGEAFDDNAPSLREALGKKQNEPDLLTQAGNLIVESVAGNEDNPSDNASFNQNAAITA